MLEFVNTVLFILVLSLGIWLLLVTLIQAICSRIDIWMFKRRLMKIPPVLSDEEMAAAREQERLRRVRQDEGA